MSVVKLSERERLQSVAYFAGNVWGGGEEALAVQHELFTVLGVEALEAKIREDNPKVSELSTELVEYELSPEAVQLLRQVLSMPGQNRANAVGSLAALRRLGD